MIKTTYSTNEFGEYHKINNANFEKIKRRLKTMEEFKEARNFCPIAWEYIGRERTFDKNFSEFFALKRTILVTTPDGDKLITHECLTKAEDWEPLFVDEHVETIFSTTGKFWCTLYKKPSRYAGYKPTTLYKDGKLVGFDCPTDGLLNTLVFVEGNLIKTFRLSDSSEKHFSYEGKLCLGGGSVPITCKNGTNFIVSNQRDVNIMTVFVDKEANNITGVTTQNICTIPGEEEVESLEVVDNSSSFSEPEDLYIIVKYKGGKEALLVVYNDFSKIMISKQFDKIAKSLEFIVYKGLPVDEEFDEGITFDCINGKEKQTLQINLERKITGDVQFEDIIKPSRISFTRPEESR